MSKTLTKTERKYISTAINFNYRIENVGTNGIGFWDGDKIMPVKVGSVCESLIQKGLLEEFAQTRYIRKTPLADDYKCKNRNCIKGTIVVYDEEEDDYHKQGECPECEGIGVLKSPRNRKINQFKYLGISTNGTCVNN